tara:strand:- start:810 stop:1706 length:897 start_codon:yes stop_codon:yes gene_type:complete
MKIKILLIFVLFSLILLLVGSTSYLRCSNISLKIFDDILGFTGIESECDKLKKENLVYVPERFNDLTFKVETTCPKDSKVILIIGQSNSSNNLLSSIDKSTKDINYNYLNNKCYELSEPVLGASGNKSSLTSSLSSKIKHKKPIIFFTAGINATSITDWSNENGFAKKINKNLKKILHTNSLNFVIWIQGETDANTNIDYISHFEKMKLSLLSQINEKKTKNNKFIITQTSICNSKKDIDLNNQQKKLQMIFDDVIVASVTDNLDENFRYDGCHFNKFGTEAITNELSEIINKEFMVQ